MSDHKERQREAERTYAQRGRVLHVSCVIVDESGKGIGPFRKVLAGGTYRIHPPGSRQTKAEKKAVKKERILDRHIAQGDPTVILSELSALV